MRDFASNSGMAYCLRVCDLHVFVSKPRRNLQNIAYLHTRLPVAKYVKKKKSVQPAVN